VTAYAVTYRSVGPRGESTRSLTVDARDDAAARDAARLILAQPTLVPLRGLRILSVADAPETARLW